MSNRLDWNWYVDEYGYVMFYQRICILQCYFNARSIFWNFQHRIPYFVVQENLQTFRKSLNLSRIVFLILIVPCAPKGVQWMHMCRFLHQGIQIVQMTHCWKVFHDLDEVHDSSFLLSLSFFLKRQLNVVYMLVYIWNFIFWSVILLFLYIVLIQTLRPQKSIGNNCYYFSNWSNHIRFVICFYKKNVKFV